VPDCESEDDAAGDHRGRAYSRCTPVVVDAHVDVGMLIFVPRVAGLWLYRTLRCYRTQILAPTEHFAAPVAAPVETTMALSVRSRHPDVCAAADEHDIAVGGSGDVYVVGFPDYLFYHKRSRDNERASRGRRTNDHSAPCGLWIGLSSELSLSACHASGQVKRSRNPGDGCSQPRMFQTMPRVPT
jgi:hypothetical protein